jgi:trans-2,3-dihydro-3-hydroxyanthranilate isomerase
VSGSRDLAFRLVDVFTPVPYAGNQLCVVPEPGDLDEETMLAITREIAFSETTFVTSVDPDGYSVRIFTPDGELPFAGHPTLGTAFVLVSEGRVPSPATQHVKAGDIPVEVDPWSNEAWMTQLPPEFGPTFDDRDLVSRAIGLESDDLPEELPIQTVSTGLPPLIVPVRDLATLRRARPAPASVAPVCEAAGAEELYVFAETDEGVTARFFGPTVAIPEDPATGSAAGPLGAYLARHGLAGMPGRVLIRQGEQVGRPSELHVEVTLGEGSMTVRVGGGVHVVGRGSFAL